MNVTTINLTIAERNVH